MLFIAHEPTGQGRRAVRVEGRQRHNSYLELF